MIVQEYYIAGFQFYGGSSSLSQLSPGCALRLAREPANRYDKNAVAVLSPAGKKLGYIPSQSNKAVARLLDQGLKIRVVVKRRDSNEPPWRMVKVRVELAGEPACMKYNRTIGKILVERSL